MNFTLLSLLCFVFVTVKRALTGELHDEGGGGAGRHTEEHGAQVRTDLRDVLAVGNDLGWDQHASSIANLRGQDIVREPSPERRSAAPLCDPLCGHADEDVVEKLPPTRMPMKPSEQASDTWSGPNHTEASRGGRNSMKTWPTATTTWPNMVTQKRSRPTDPTLIQEPSEVRPAATISAQRSPCRHRHGRNFTSGASLRNSS